MNLLKTKPQKDGIITEYACGLKVHGGWRTRLEKHQEFCDSQMGKYILVLESKVENLPVSDVRDRLKDFLSKQQNISEDVQSVINEKFWDLI